MAKIPDIMDLGNRPIPVSRRQITTNPGAGVVGRALEGFGATVSGIGNQMIEREDKLSYAKAKAHVLKEDIAARQELEKDPDYATWQPRYDARMKVARETASGMIRSRSDRTLFEADVEIDVARGSGEIAGAVTKRSNDADLGAGMQVLDDLQDVGIDAPDDATREAALGTISQTIAGMQQRGLITAVQAQELRRGKTQDYVIQRAEVLKRAGDPDGAERWVAANRGRLDPAAENSLLAQIDEAKKDRKVLTAADFVMSGAEIPGMKIAAPSAAPAQTFSYADPLRGAGGAPIPGGRYGAGRDYGAHKGADLTGARGTPIMSGAGGGKVKVQRGTRTGGNVVTIDHGGGVVTKYMHLDAVNVRDGQAVDADTVIGTLGSTGRASGPNLHYEVLVDGKHVDPTKLSGNVPGGPRQSPRDVSMKDKYARADAYADANDFTPEEREDLKAQVQKQITRDQQLLDEQYRDAAREATIVLASMPPEGITDISQIPISVRNRMDPVKLAELQAEARKNRTKGNEIKPKGGRATELEIVKRTNPELFKQLDLSGEVGKMTQDELRGFVLDQATLLGKSGEEENHRGGIQSAITWGSKYGGVKVDDKDFPAVYDVMEGYIQKVAKTKTPTKDDYDAAFKAATRDVTLPDGGWFYSNSKRSIYEFTVDNIPDNVISEIRKSWAGPKPITDTDIERIFRARYADRVQ